MKKNVLRPSLSVALLRFDSSQLKGRVKILVFFSLLLVLFAVHAVVSVPGPVFAPPVVSGGKLVLTGSGGPPGGTYYLLTTTNVAGPLANWTRLSINTFSATGTFSNAVPINLSEPQRFYALMIALGG